MPRKTALFAAALAPLTAMACECGLPHTMTLPGEPGAAILASVRREYVHGDSLYVGENHVANPAGEYLHTTRTSFLIGGEIAEGLSLFIAPQYVSRRYRAAHEGAAETGTVAGFTDLPLGVNYLGCLHHGKETHLHAGFSLAATAPLGDTAFLGEEAAHHADHDVDNEAPSGVHGHDLALGTGAWGGVFAARFALESGPWILEGNAHLTLRPEGDYGYDHAESFGWNLLAGGKLLKSSAGATALLISVTGDHEGNDRINGVVEDRTNHDHLYAGPVVRHTAPGGATLEARLELPVYVRTGAPHLAASWRAQAAVSFGF